MGVEPNSRAAVAEVAGGPLIRTPDQRLRVFISSTLEELAPERVAARRAVEGLHLTPVMFELGASPHPPRPLYRAYLEQSHVFVGIYWQRYGWVAPDMDVSGLEDEFLLSVGMPRLVYLKQPAPEREDRMGEFASRIKSDGGLSFRKFEDAGELTELILDDLAHLLTERFESVGAAVRASPEQPNERSRVPVPITRLVGREPDIESVRELLGWEDVRLVTLTGVGGIGKSRLALEVAREEAEAGAEVVFVDLTPVANPDSFPRAVAAAIGVSDDGARPLVETIVARLRDRRALLMLDNFEQILAAAGYVSEIIAECPKLKVMVTSRALLDVRGEHQWEVKPLEIPSNGKSRNLDGIASSAAVELFVERAQGADPRFTLSERNASEVSELCSRLEGLPLALELTAAYVKLLPPAALLERFDRRLDLEGHADHPQRQRTLRATIDWSYGLLDEDERELFARLAVFTGGWDLRAAQAVCQPGCVADVLQTLSDLVDKSLVTIDDRRGGEPRFRMLETVRDYALQRLTDSGHFAEMLRRHAEYFAELCAETGARLEEHEMWFPVLDADLDNILVLAPRAIEDESLVEPLIRAWSSIWLYAWARGLVRGVEEAMEAVESAIGATSRETRAAHAFLMAACLFLTGKAEEARTWAKRVLDLAGGDENERLRGLALTLLGASTPYETARDEAEASLSEAVAIFRRIDLSLGVTIALAQLGGVMLRDGRVEEAIEMHRECLEIGRTMKADAMTAFALSELAVDNLTVGRIDEARAFLVENAELCRRLERVGNRETTAYCLEGLATVAFARGDPALGARLIGASRAIRENIATPVWAIFAPLTEALVGAVRESLGEERFEKELAAGATIPAEQVLDVALEGTAGDGA